MSDLDAVLSPPDRGWRYFWNAQTRWSTTVLIIGIISLTGLFVGTIAVLTSYGWTQDCPPGATAIECSWSDSLARGLASSTLGAVILSTMAVGVAAAVAAVTTYRRMPTRPAREAVISGGILGLITALLALMFTWFRQTDLDLFARNFLNFRRIGLNIGISGEAVAADLGNILRLAVIVGGVCAALTWAWTRARQRSPKMALWAGLVGAGLGALWGVLNVSAVPSFARGAQNTLVLSSAGAALGFVLGLIIALFAMSKRAVVRAPARVYINFFRGTPLIWQMSFAGIGIVPALSLGLSMYTVAILVLGLNLAAYSAEVYRSGVQSLERGQMEASRSLGLTYGQSMRFVIVPQAVRRVIPPLLNEFVILIKDTSLVIVLGLTLAQRELLGTGRALYSQTFDATAWLGVAAGYLIITLPLIRIVTVIEKRMRSGLTSAIE